LMYLLTYLCNWV